MNEQDHNTDNGAYFSAEPLVAAREALGLTQDTIQRELRLTSRVMVALESGDIKGIGQPVFARGYIRSYCKRVGIPADDIIAQFDAAIGQVQPKRSRIREMTSSSVPASASMSIANNQRKPSGFLSGAVKLGAVVIVVAGLGYAASSMNMSLTSFDFSSFFGENDAVVEPNSNQLVIPGTSSVNLGQSSIPISIDAEPTAVADEPSIDSLIESQPESQVIAERVEIQTEVVTSIQPLVDQAAIAAEPEAVDVSPSVTPDVLEVQQEVVPVPAVESPAATQSATTSPSSSDGLAKTSITFADVSWVNIKDGRGNAIFNGLAERGRTLELSGQPPINFVIGRADAVSSLTFNGVTVDLDSYTRKNVARLTLPQ